MNPVFVAVFELDSSQRRKRRRDRGFFERDRWRIISLRSRLRIRLDFSSSNADFGKIGT